jgi:tetratricopeptide (TPR) repeat protein
MSNSNAELIQRAAAAFQRSAWAEAAQCCELALRQFGEDANALMILGTIEMQNGDVARAIVHYERARAAMPTHIHVLVNLGSAYREVGRLRDARDVLEKAVQVDRRFAIAHNNLGNVLLDLGDREAAKGEYEQAMAVQPDYAEPVAALARIAEEEHRLDDARRLSERALFLAPQNVLARLIRARTELRDGDPAQARGMLEALLREAPTHTNRVVAEGYLGEACDKLGRYDDAFAAFARANDLQLAQHAAANAMDQGPMAPQTVTKLTAFVAATDLATWREAPPLNEAAPVFLIGFPRSGTTLLDQILASHPQITTLEERDTLVVLADALIASGHDFERWPTLPAHDIEQLRAAYWEHVAAGLRGAPMESVFVDKQPLNSVLLPLIYRLFPTAKILLAIRDPRDVLLSCFQQRFGMNAAMFQLLQLDTAAAYYDSIMSLVRASRKKFPLRMHEVKYETLVDAFEATVRGLLDFLEVPWDDAVLSYAETARKRTIGTPSAAQVVQPIYASSRGKWRNYRDHLEPHLARLEPWVTAFGYEPSRQHIAAPGKTDSGRALAE